MAKALRLVFTAGGREEILHTHHFRKHSLLMQGAALRLVYARPHRVLKQRHCKDF